MGGRTRWRSVARLDAAADRERLQALLREADVVLEPCTPEARERLGLGAAALRALNPRLVACSITPYGRSGPKATLRGSDLTALAASGNLFMTGDADRAPVRCSMPVTHYHGAPPMRRWCRGPGSPTEREV